MTIVSCDCKAFRAELTGFPKNTPGRLVCYCKDCQDYLNRLGRVDVLDAYGGTEVVPVYPNEIRILEGLSLLTCYRLHERGLDRWATSCCNSPILNSRPGFPWSGIMHNAYKQGDHSALGSLGEVKSRIFGRDAQPGAPFKISEKISLGDLSVVLPFIVKGKVLRKANTSPLYNEDNVTPISAIKVLSA